MLENLNEVALPETQTYITIQEAIDRTIIGTSLIAGITREHHEDNAWTIICSHLMGGDISGAIIKQDGRILPVEKDFWQSSAAYAFLRNQKQVVGTENQEFDGSVLVSETEFRQVMERFVRPLPASEMPPGLIFISSTDDDGTKFDLTYMSISDALNAFSDQRRAYIEEDIRSNWDVSQELFRNLLESGSIKSFHRSRKGMIRLLDPNDWRLSGPILYRIARQRTKIKGTSKLGESWLPYMDIQLEDRAHGGAIIVLYEEVISALKSSAAESEDNKINNALISDRSSSEASSSRSGRPPKYDIQSFMIEAFKIMYLGDPTPRSLDQLCERTLAAYRFAQQGQGRVAAPLPSDTWMKDCLRPLYAWCKDKNSETGF